MEIYLDNAATSHPKPEEVLIAVRDALTIHNGNPGRSGHARALEGGRIVLAAREALQRLFHLPDPDLIAFCFNCTDALNLAIKGSLHKGDHVIASALEHNSVLRVLMELQARELIEVTLVEPDQNGEVPPEKYQGAARPNTRLAILTHASNVTGVIQPVAAVGGAMREMGIRFLIDGAQAVGHFPVNLSAIPCDLYAFPGHKGLLAPQGTGGLYIAPDLALNTLREGGTGSVSNHMRQPTERPERYESGTANLPGIAGLLAGVEFVAKRQQRIRDEERALTDALIGGLRAMPGITLYTSDDRAARAGVVSFNVGDLTSSQTADLLAEREIAVRGGLHCAPGAHQWLGTLARGAVRASVGWATTEEDVEGFLRAIHEIAKGV